MKSDRIVAVCAVLLAAVYFYATEQIPNLQIGDPMGAKAIPRLLGVALIASAALLWLENWLASRKATPESAAAPPGRRQYVVVAGAVLWTALYFVVFDHLGFALATTVYLFALMAYFNRGRWTANALTSVLFSFGSYLAFTRLFGAPLARGILPF